MVNNLQEKNEICQKIFLFYFSKLKMVAMLSKNDIKHYSSLLKKKFRNIENQFIVEGQRLLDEALSSGFKPEIIIISEQFRNEFKQFVMGLENSGLKIETIKNNDFKKLSDTKSPQGILGIFKKFETKDINTYGSKNIIALENISDPGNLGTIFRNCDWFGIKNVLLSSDCTEIYNPKVIRASMGSIFHLNIIECDHLYSELEDLKAGYHICCADMNGENIFEIDSDQKRVITFCNEANGPSDQLLKVTDSKLTIPKIGKVESLNVASASAVILAEITK